MGQFGKTVYGFILYTPCISQASLVSLIFVIGKNSGSGIFKTYMVYPWKDAPDKVKNNSL